MDMHNGAASYMVKLVDRTECLITSNVRIRPLAFSVGYARKLLFVVRA